MAPLPPDLRRGLEQAVVKARETAEQGAGNALAVLGVTREPAPSGLSDGERALRVALRARARSLGNGLTFDGIPALTEEIAYAAWHRMLFARFLAENGLLVEPVSGAAVSMEDVTELARDAGESDPWVMAARYAAEQLPGIFGTDDPTTQVVLAPDDRVRLETILRNLPAAVFTSDDALGWVYQFWQSKRKDDVNKAGKKVGAGDLSPVTQLFTEHYMVRFLLENSLGAWWAGRHPDSPLLREWEYLRYRDDGTPAAGTFEGWPERAAEVTVMDPCMGSGHFLVAAGEMLRKMRMEEEGLTAAQAARAVIADNLHGLELDPRCTQIGAFAVAFDAWKAAGGHIELPVPHIACSGIAVKGQLDDWRRLAGDDANLRIALTRLYELFQDAPELGSLIDPRAAAGNDLLNIDPERLLDKLDQALAKEVTDPAAAVFGAAAQGTAKAARLLAGRYWLVATNPPFLGFKKMSALLAKHTAATAQSFRYDLATAFLRHGLRLAHQRGATYMVAPQNWVFLGSYETARRELLAEFTLQLLATLGPGAFDAISGEVVKVVLVGIRKSIPAPEGEIQFLDAGLGLNAADKSILLRTAPLVASKQADQVRNPDARISAVGSGGLRLLSEFAEGLSGVQTGDFARFGRSFWEGALGRVWIRLQGTVQTTTDYGGRESALRWEDGRGQLEEFARLNRERLHDSHRRGMAAWGKAGVAVGLVNLSVTLYSGDAFDNNTGVVLPRDPGHLPSIWAFCSSPEYVSAVRQIDQKLNVTNATLVKVPFDLEHWTEVAAEQYPDGLPKPHSDDPTQWLFKGRIAGSEAPLQVAVARLLGYRWPDQPADALDAHADRDGIVVLPAVAGDAPADERLEALLAAAYGPEWSNARRAQLLTATGGKATTLDAWLRDELFEQHARLFHNRPFIWQVWDGRKDGFSALLHYHRLDRANLEKVTYHHLGDWIARQEADARDSVVGADARLKAARELQAKLRAILEGEDPYDIYVRWKPLAQQPVGWEPDLDDGVRLNIRPFVTAGVLRARFTINWNKDRGTDPDGSERHNDRRISLAEKLAARGQR